jgi:hypothetical protein
MHVAGPWPGDLVGSPSGRVRVHQEKVGLVGGNGIPPKGVRGPHPWRRHAYCHTIILKSSTGLALVTKVPPGSFAYPGHLGRSWPRCPIRRLI